MLLLIVLVTFVVAVDVCPDQSAILICYSFLPDSRWGSDSESVMLPLLGARAPVALVRSRAAVSAARICTHTTGDLLLARATVCVSSQCSGIATTSNSEFYSNFLSPR